MRCDFVKRQFTVRLNWNVLGLAVLMQVLIFILSLFFLSSQTELTGFRLSFPGIGVLLLIFADNLIRGPLGEELGWRGYLLNELQKKHSTLTAAVILGVLWGLWHTPLWFVSGYSGWQLVQYCVFFMMGIISFSIIVTFFYTLNSNLLIPVIMHQLFNYLLTIVKTDLISIFSYTSLIYLLVAVLLIVINPGRVLFKRQGLLHFFHSDGETVKRV